MTETRTHARLSPSSAERWTTCPASVFHAREFGDTSSEHADYGTAGHKVAEWCLKEGTDAAAYKGRRIDVKAGKTIEVDADMVELVQTYVDNIRARVKMYEDAGALEVELHVELDVPISHITGEEDAEGGADCPIVARFIDRVVLDMSDLKTGYKRVSAYRNKQLAMYTDGVIEMLGLRGDVDEINLAIHQPRVSQEPNEATMTVAEFDELIGEIRAKAERAILFVDSDTPPTDSDYAPSDDACMFCPKRATCPALQRTVQDAIGVDFDDLDKMAGPIEALVGADMPTTDVSRCMDLVDLIESWCKAVRAEVERRLFDGQDVPGYKLVQGRKGARAWANAEEAEKALKAYRLKVEEMYDLKLISPTSAEKLAKAGTIGPRQWPKLATLITQSEGSPSVAPESDKRPALVVQKPSADDFDSLVEDDEGSLV